MNVQQPQPQPSLLVKDYNRWRYWKGIGFDEAIIVRPYHARVSFGFDQYFGAGKSPFKPAAMILDDDRVHVLVDEINFRQIKWRHKLQEWLGITSVLFYHMSHKREWAEWSAVCENLDAVMENPIWQTSTTLP